MQNCDLLNKAKYFFFHFQKIIKFEYFDNILNLTQQKWYKLNEEKL